MYYISCVDSPPVPNKGFTTLNEAMAYAKQLGRFVAIKGGDMEIVGKFGVDAVADGVCPDGVEYSWVKRRKK
jgi:hypothetical protein